MQITFAIFPDLVFRPLLINLANGFGHNHWRYQKYCSTFTLEVIGMIYFCNGCLYFSWFSYGQLISGYLLKQHSDFIELFFINFVGHEIGGIDGFHCS